MYVNTNEVIFMSTISKAFANYHLCPDGRHPFYEFVFGTVVDLSLCSLMLSIRDQKYLKVT